MSTHKGLIRFLLLAAAAACVACGGSAASSSSAAGATAREGRGPTPAADTFLGHLEAPPIAVAAELLVPRALEDAEWPMPAPSRSIAAQRKRFESAGDASRFAEAEALAAVLWRSVAPDHPDSKMLREEARGLLRRMAGEQRPTEMILLELAVAERSLGDPSRAGALYDSLILRFPQSPRHWQYRAERAWLALRTGDLATAGEVIDGADLAAQTTPAAVHYVAGWLSFRRGEYAEGLARTTVAAQRWDDLRSWDTLRSEVYAMAGFAAAPPEYMLRVVDELIAGPPKREKGTAEVRERTIVQGGKRVVVTANQVAFYDRHWDVMMLGRAYLNAGESESARILLNAAHQGSEMVQTGAHLALARLDDAAGNPTGAADGLVAAWSAVRDAEAVGDVGDETLSRDGVAGAILAAARRYDALARAGAGEAYRAAALRLYATYAAVPGRADTAVVLQRSTALEGAVPSETLDAETVFILAGISVPTLATCYARWLQRTPTLAGTVIAVVVVNDAAQAELARIDPAANGEGLPAVAACVARHVSGLPWPAAPIGQTWTLTLPYSFAAR